MKNLKAIKKMKPVKSALSASPSKRKVAAKGPDATKASDVPANLSDFPDLAAFPVKLFVSPKKGRYVVSNIQAEPGMFIMFSRAYATALYRHSLAGYCSACHKRLRSSDQNMVSEFTPHLHYCSLQCRRSQRHYDRLMGPSHASFLAEIDKNMKIFQSHKDPNESLATLLLAVRVFARRCTELKNLEQREEGDEMKEMSKLHKCYFSHAGFVNSLNFAAIERLTRNKTKIVGTPRYQELHEIASFIHNFYGDKGLLFGLDFENVLDLVLRLEGNGFKINHGHGIFPTISLINHSCEPNCAVVGSDESLFLEVRRPIKIGDEITIDYGFYDEKSKPTDLGSLRTQCKAYMKDVFYFECSCRV